ncbi:MAG: lipopolysaccharide biosynthesis protein, partial [Eubacterium sp.]|nr:lipopolysaccharide biosynthesis protein [Eubacterium sp.]
MLDSIAGLLEKTNNVQKSSYLWNAINAVLSAVQCPVILMVIMRTNGKFDSGVFSIAFAVASLMLYVGLYGLRRFQASDINEEYSFAEYHGMRFITCAVMILAVLLY